MPARTGTRHDLALQGCAPRATVLRRLGWPQELLLQQGPCHVRLLNRSGSVEHGPVRLRLALYGLRNLDRQMLTVRQIAALSRSERLPTGLTARERMNGQWIALLRLHDGLAMGASQRQLAQCLFGEDWVSRGWNGESDFLRSRLRRMKNLQHRLVTGGYRTLLR